MYNFQFWRNNYSSKSQELWSQKKFLWKISKYGFFCLEKGAIWRYKFNENLERKIDKKLLIPGVIHTSHTWSHARRAPTVLSQETALETTVHTAFLATVAGLARKHSKWWTSNFLCLQTPRALRFNSGHLASDWHSFTSYKVTRFKV